MDSRREDRFDRATRRVLVAVCATAGASATAAVAVSVLGGGGLAAWLAGGAAATPGLAWLHRELGRWMAGARGLAAAAERWAAGELEVRFSAAPADPWAPLAHPLDATATRVRSLVGRARDLARALDRFPEQSAATFQALAAGGEAQEQAVEETAALLADINQSIRAINGELESLSGATEEASASVVQMGSAVDEVARSAGALHDAMNSSTASIHQISASIRQVASSADAVQAMAEETAAAITQMDRAIQEVSEHVREASVLTERVSHEAEDGSAAVATTIDGIEAIRSHVLGSQEVLGRLAARVGEIGDILDVIGDINDETHLLSLNAAIIAAQAGEQGKAFAVVANHVKTLAQRTAGSMQEIERLIRAVQQESSNVVHTMGEGIDAVEAGVERSRRAGTALEAIRTSAHDASSRVAEIARAALEQSRNSKHVADAAQRTSEMVQQITTAMAEQQRASEQILRNAQEGLELCGQVHRSTQEQRESGRFIHQAIASIAERIRSIRANTEAHAAASEAVSATVARILEVGRATGEQVPSLLETLDAPRAEAEALERELERFRSAVRRP